MQQIVPLPPNVVNRGPQAQSSQGSPWIGKICTPTEHNFPIQGHIDQRTSNHQMKPDSRAETTPKK
jgi:hypothetical protein